MRLEPSSKLGLTRRRAVIRAVVCENTEHLTATQIFALAKEQLPTISFATVYNSLRYLKEAGLIVEINFGSGASRFDGMTHRHDHALCTSCGRLVDLDLDAPAELVERAARSANFKPQSLEFTLRGKCPDCVNN